MSEEALFTLFYLLFVIFVLYPPAELVSAGLTTSSLFAKYLGNESENFILYHAKKINLTLITYSLLPLGYILLLFLLGYTPELQLLLLSSGLIWKVFFATSIALPLLALYQVKTWTDNDYSEHPIMVKLRLFSPDWKRLAADISSEVRSINKIIIHSSTITTIIATDNWILKLNPLTMHVAYQSDTTFQVKDAPVYKINPQSQTEVQFLNIEVKSQRPAVETFTIRINSTDFKDLQDRIVRNIVIPDNVKFHKSVVDQFIDVFKATVEQNPKFRADLVAEQCVGCLQAEPNVKLNKQCVDGQNSCTNCYCRPMWCLDCIAKWFTSRLATNDQQNTWLSSKCTCPMCRATFCVRDVCILDK